MSATTTDVLFVCHTDARNVAKRLRGDFPSLRVADFGSEEEGDVARADVEILMTMGLGLTAERIEQMPNLRWIQAMVSGVDHFLPAITGRDLIVTTCRGTHGPQIAEFVIAQMLVLNRDLQGFFEDQQKRRWNYARGENAPLLKDKTVAIVGMGAIGRALAPLCKAHGMTVVGVSNAVRDCEWVDRYRPRGELKGVVSEADFIVLAVPHTSETNELVDADLLASFKEGSCLINVGRGGLVDEEALIQALRTGPIGGAGLDVASREPLPESSPLWTLPNVFVTPHVAGSCDVYAEHIYPVIAENVRLYLEGDYERMVNRLSRTTAG